MGCRKRFVKRHIGILVLWLTVTAFPVFGQATFGQSLKQKALFDAPTRISPWFGSTGGVVRDESGQPVAGAIVIYDSGHHATGGSLDQQCRYQTETDQDGAFQFPVDATTRSAFFGSRLQVIHPDYSLHSQSVRESQVEVALKRGHSITGRIVDHHGVGIDGITVSMLPWSTDPLLKERGTMTTDEQGRFQIHHVQEEEWGVHFSIHKPGIVERTIGWAPAGDDLSEYIFENAIPVTGDFTLKLPDLPKVEIHAVDAATGESVSLAAIVYESAGKYPKLRRGEALDYLPHGNVRSNPAFSHLEPGIWRFYCQPERDGGWLGAFFVVTIPDDLPKVAQKVGLRRGILVKGRVVDETSSQPVPDVAIQYFWDDPESFVKLGVLPQQDVRTDENGYFEIRVPSHPGEIRMVGEVAGYVTLPVQPQIRDEFRERFAYRIPAGSDSVDGVEFRLQPAPVVGFRVVDEYGDSLSGISWVATRLRSGPSPGTLECGRTGMDGEFETTQLFDDAAYNYDEPSEVRPSMMPGRLADKTLIRTNQIFCWNPENYRCGSLILTPDEISPNRIHEITLRAGHTANGRLLNRVTKKPLAGVRVAVGMSRRGDIEIFWETQTNVNGEFVFHGLFPNAHYKMFSGGDFSGGDDYHAEQRSFNTGASKVPCSLGDIDVYVDPPPNYQFDVPDVSGLEAETAINRLVDFVNEALEKSPERRNPQSTGSREPKQIYINKLGESMDTIVLDLLADNPDIDFQCRTCLALLLEFDNQQFGRLPAVAWTGQARELLSKHIDRDGVFPKYRKLDWAYQTVSYDSWIIENSESPEIRAWAFQELLPRYWGELVSACNPLRVTDAQFEETLEKTRELLKTGMNELGKVIIEDSTEGKKATVEQKIRVQSQRIFSSIKRDRAADEERSRRVGQMLRQIDPKNRL